MLGQGYQVKTVLPDYKRPWGRLRKMGILWAYRKGYDAMGKAPFAQA